MTDHEKQQLVDEGTHEWCETCGGTGTIEGGRHYSDSYTCGDCDGEGVVTKEIFDV